MVDAKPVDLAKQRKRKKARLKAFGWMRETYPALFSHPPRPIAVGIGKGIVAAASASGAWSTLSSARNAVGAALHFHVNSIAYLSALAEPGAYRYALNGEPVEPVSEEHRAEAAKLLEARRAGPRGDHEIRDRA
jgi:sRNA-binding protein